MKVKPLTDYQLKSKLRNNKDTYIFRKFAEIALYSGANVYGFINSFRIGGERSWAISAIPYFHEEKLVDISNKRKGKLTEDGKRLYNLVRGKKK